MNVPLLDLKAQYRTLRDEIRPVIDEVCDSQYFINGPRVEAFEESVAAYCGTADAIGVSSGTDALLVALMAMDVGPGDTVLTTPYTFFATVGSIVRVGARPVFVDIDPVTFNMDPVQARATLEAMDGPPPKAMIPVHLYGQAADMNPLMDLASDYGMQVIEDGAQAIGVEYMYRGDVRKTGSIGDAGCFSFFPSKNLGGFGDGGIVTTNDEELAERIRQLRNHGSEPKYYHKLIGGNFRLDALQAAVLEVKLTYLDGWHEDRRSNANLYTSLLADSAVKTPAAIYADQGLTNYHIYNQYIIRLANRDEVRAALVEAQIGCDIYYPLSLHMQECFSALGYSEGDFPESERAASETLAIPVYPELTDEMQEYVAATLIAAVA